MGWVFVIIIVFFLLGWRFQGKGPDTYGSAAWLSIWTAYKKRLFKNKGLLVGDWVGAKGSWCLLRQHPRHHLWGVGVLEGDFRDPAKSSL